TKGRKMWDYVKLVALGVIALCAAIAANYARDLAYMVNAVSVMLVAGGLFLWQVRRVGDEVRPKPALQTEYMDGVIRYGVV
ncbi:putative cytochrome C oxidase subunit 1, partial [Anaerococcus lactolyticus ATCC 51172]